MKTQGWRKSIAYVLVFVLCLGALYAIRWVWRDITYWQKSVTVAHTAGNLGECVAMAVADWPEVSVPPFKHVITLDMSGRYDALVKGTDMPGIARIVVYGHSASISKLGPADDEPVEALLQKLSDDITRECGGA